MQAPDGSPADGPTTSYYDVVSHFAGRSPQAAARLHRWRSDPDKARRVVPWVEQAVTRIAYAQRPEELLQVAEQTEHALGEVKRAEAERVKSVRDWHPSFAFQHVFHHAAETLGGVPTYQAFRDFCRTDALAGEMLVAPARQARDRAVRMGWTADEAAAAVRWRVGNAYYAYLKEAFSIAVLREAGIDARYHVVADALFRTDLWVGDVCLSVYVDNRFFKSGISGRKPRAEEILGDGPFRFVHLEMATKHEFGTVHLPDPEGLVELVRSLT